MEEILFYLGILAGLSFMQGVMTWSMRHKKRPYLLAFSCLMFWESTIVLTEALCHLWFGVSEPETISTGLDYLMFPLFYLEVLCLTNQDVSTMPWSKRWQRTLLVSLPVIIYFIIILSTDITEFTLFLNIYLLTYIIVLMTLMTHHVHKFRVMLKKGTNKSLKEDQDVRWVPTILSLMILQYLMYILYDYLPYSIIYFGTSYFIVLLHGYFIRKQAPTDTKKLMAMQEELMEKQDEAIEELKDATDGLKRKKDMEIALKAFRMKHPSFDTRLRNTTETKLTQRDIFLCILIYEGKRIPEIADFLGISPASVEVARHRLRTKLNLDKGANMNRVIQSVIEDASLKAPTPQE